MQRRWQTFQRYPLLRATVYLLTGLLALLYPQQSTQWLIYLIAIYVAFFGMINILSGLREKSRSNQFGFEMYVGLFLVVIALLILALAKPLLTLATIFLGIFILINGFLRLSQVFELKNMNQPFLSLLFYSVILIIAGFILMFNAITSIMTLVGSVFIFMGLSELIRSFSLRK